MSPTVVADYAKGLGEVVLDQSPHVTVVPTPVDKHNRWAMTSVPNPIDLNQGHDSNVACALATSTGGLPQSGALERREASPNAGWVA